MCSRKQLDETQRKWTLVHVLFIPQISATGVPNACQALGTGPALSTRNVQNSQHTSPALEGQRLPAQGSALLELHQPFQPPHLCRGCACYDESPSPIS